MADTLKFDAPKNISSIIKVIGVGGGGGNAVNYMFKQGIQGVDFVICNTDAKALINSPIPVKIQLGSSGLGAGNIAEIGRQAALESVDDIRKVLGQGTEMLFVTACMGGGTGTGGAPVVAALAKEMGILTVAIITIPFSFEGRKRVLQAQEGIKELRQNVDSLLIICNDRIRELHRDLSLSDAFGMADNVLSTAAKGIAEIITVDGYVNIDFNDVKTVMSDSGVAIMGSGLAEGPNRALEAAKQAISSPLLNDNEIRGASNILLYIGAGPEMLMMNEVEDIIEFIQTEAGSNADIIWGNCFEESLGNKLSLTLVATGFQAKDTITPTSIFEKPEKKIYDLEGEIQKEPEMPKDEEFNRFVNPMNIKLIHPEAEHEKGNIIEQEEQPKESQVIHDLYSEEEIPQNNVVSDDDMVLIKRNPEPKIEAESVPVFRQMEISKEIDETLSTPKSQERINKLREMSLKLKTQEGLEEMENTPAYVRQKIELKDPETSSEIHTSRYSLFGDENSAELRSGNSFIHDKAD